jgi:hypothetical protein
MAARIAFQPFIGLSATLTSVSSQDLVYPARRLRDPAPGAIWRSKIGWNITDAFNDKLDFTEDGTARVATLTLALNYATGALLATHVTARMNAAPGAVNTYLVTYDGVTTKFTIARATGTAALVLKFGDGANLVRSVHLDLGFTSTNKTSATTYTAENVAFKGREWVKIQLAAAASGSFAAAVNHNMSSAGTATLQGNATDAWSAPTLTQVLSDISTGPLPMRTKFFTPASFIWWRLTLTDVQNSAAFTELGMFHVSGFIEPALDFKTPWAEERDELSAISFSDQGASYVDEKPTRTEWPLTWPALTAGEKQNFDGWIDFVRKGKSFFFAFEPTADPTFVRYVMLADDVKWIKVPPLHWAASAKLRTILA